MEKRMGRQIVRSSLMITARVTSMYYMYFYAFDQGNAVLGQEIGDHVGDWEHNMIRFKNGIPQAIW